MAAWRWHLVLPAQLRGTLPILPLRGNPAPHCESREKAGATLATETLQGRFPPSHSIGSLGKTPTRPRDSRTESLRPFPGHSRWGWVSTKTTCGVLPQARGCLAPVWRQETSSPVEVSFGQILGTCRCLVQSWEPHRHQQRSDRDLEQARPQDSCSERRAGRTSILRPFSRLCVHPSEIWSCWDPGPGPPDSFSHRLLLLGKDLRCSFYGHKWASVQKHVCSV